MTIIVTKLGIIINVVGSYFYDKKIMIENELFVLGGPEMQLHDILWAVHDGKNRGRSDGEQNIGVFLVTVGGRGRAMHGGLHVSLIHARAWVRGVGL